MKKLFSLLILLFMWVPLSGFSSVSSNTVLCSSGAVQEIVEVEYSEADAIKLNTSMHYLTVNLTTIANLIVWELDNKMQTKFYESALAQHQTIKESFLVAQAHDVENHKITIVITYKDTEVWNLFRKNVLDQTQQTTEQTFFTTKYITTSPLKLSAFDDGGVEKNLQQYVYDRIIVNLANLYGDVENILTTNYSYTYSTKVVRLHSDADVVEKTVHSSGGYYYDYTWNFEGEENPQITLWQVRANYVNWYLLAVGLTVVFGFVLWFVSIKKHKTNVKELS